MHAARTAAAAGRADGLDKRESVEVNKRIFDALHAKKEQVEAVFGAPLGWLRMDDAKASAITYCKPFDGRNHEDGFARLVLAKRL